MSMSLNQSIQQSEGARPMAESVLRPSSAEGETLSFEACGIECRRGGRLLFSGVDFRLGAGEILQIEGANGSGKTSLLRILSGLMPPSKGSVRWCGRDISKIGTEYLQNLNYVGHKPGIKDHLTPSENLRFSREFASGCTETSIHDGLKRVGLDGFHQVPVRTLSAGQGRRVALARLLVNAARLWLLDEPLAALDKSGKTMVEDLLREHLSHGGMVVVTTHQSVDVGFPLAVVNLG